MARELPTGIEWPRYEDGGLLEIGDIVPVCGKYEELLQVHLGLNAFSLYTETCDEEHMYGQRFKRTVLDADGALIKDGDTVFMTGNWRRGTVVGFEGEFALVEYDARDVNGSTMTVRTAGGCLTHKQPVIDADGVPIKVGDTVYFTDGREQECNTVVNAKYDYKDEPYVQLGRLNEAGYPTYTNCSCIDPSQLTHTKPEPPDTWERIEDDATLEAATYCERRGIDVETGYLFVEPMARDLVRRCRALAERGE